jgi:hypothetical protein
MEIKTKFDIGQEVWIIKQYKKQKDVFEEENFYKIENYIIIGIYACVLSDDLIKNKYHFDNWYKVERYGFMEDLAEKLIFATKAEAEQKLKEIENER